MRSVLCGAQESRSVTQKNVGLLRKLNLPVTRLLTDLVGDDSTLVIESEVPDLAAFEEGLQSGFADAEWQAFYGQIRSAVRGGRREIFTVLE